MSTIAGRKRRSVVAFARPWASAIWRRRNEADLALRLERIRAPSAPARRTLAASSRSEEALGRGVRPALGIGHLAPSQRGGLGTQARADTRPLGPGKAHAGRELLELVDTQLSAEPAETVPRRSPGVTRSVERAPDAEKRRVSCDRARGLQRALDSHAACLSQGDQLEPARQGVEEISPRGARRPPDEQ